MHTLTRRPARNPHSWFDFEVFDYYRGLALTWAVSIDHNYSYIRRGLGLKPTSR